MSTNEAGAMREEVVVSKVNKKHLTKDDIYEELKKPDTWMGYDWIDGGFYLGKGDQSTRPCTKLHRGSASAVTNLPNIAHKMGYYTYKHPPTPTKEDCL